jgi:glutamate formiminotransferase/glutamate formiminotransferase/formiminotetrahydrofolate cyclodeaminase
MESPILLAVPNVSEGRDERTIAAVAAAFTGGVEVAGDSSSSVRLLDVHRDGDHHRSVFTLAGSPANLVEALMRGARAAVERIDVIGSGPARGEHPYVGALDVAPLVYLDARAQGAACAIALVVADRIGEELGVPVFLYGDLSAGRARAELRRGGPARLQERIAAGELRPDFGPARLHPTAGATLIAARAPLVAFNLQLAAPATVKDARAIAALIREGGTEGLPGVRAIGVALGGGVAQVSMNVERPLDVPLARVVEAVARHARVSTAELVGLAPRAAMEDFPEDLPLPGFDPARHTIENALGL